MADDEIAEAMQLLSSMPWSDVTSLLTEAFSLVTKSILESCFDNPAPPPAVKRIVEAARIWKSDEARLLRLFGEFQNQKITVQPLPPMIEVFGFDPITGLPRARLHELPSRPESHWSSRAAKQAEALLGRNREGLAKTLKNDGARGAAASRSAQDAPKSTAAPQTAGRAMVNGACLNAVLTAGLDCQNLIDGEYKQYLSNVGGSALHGTSLAGLKALIRHDFFGHGTVLSVAVNTGFEAVSLAHTGDWARFGKNGSLNVAGGLGAWGGSAGATYLIGTAGASFSAPLILPILGALVVGQGDRWLATKVPGIGGETQYEGATREVASQIQQLEDVTQLRDVLDNMRSTSPESFAIFLHLLRTASQE